MSRLSHDLETMSYFLLAKDGILVSIQDGVFRTNCIDCLDRTNVVQSMLAKIVLADVLDKLQIIHKIEEHPSLEYMFKQVDFIKLNFLHLDSLGIITGLG